jgi:hypothetical protein
MFEPVIEGTKQWPIHRCSISLRAVDLYRWPEVSCDQGIVDMPAGLYGPMPKQDSGLSPTLHKFVSHHYCDSFVLSNVDEQKLVVARHLINRCR